MEIKKYVLLTDYGLILDGKNENEIKSYHYPSYDEIRVVAIDCVGGDWNYPLKELNHIMSDNILDLVEVGDLVEINEMNGIYYVDSIITDEGLRVFTCDQKHGYWFDFNETEVKAIYKRQPNGDYKRYEVKNNGN